MGIESQDESQVQQPHVEVTGIEHEESLARTLLFALRANRTIEGFAALERNDQTELYFRLQHFLASIRESAGYFWSDRTPEGKIRSFRENGILHPEVVDRASLSISGNQLLDKYRQNIETWHEEGIGHLCLSRPAFDFLVDLGIETILRSEELLAGNWPDQYTIRPGLSWGESKERQLRQKIAELKVERLVAQNDLK